MNNQQFEYTKDHFSMEYLESLRQISDSDADKVLLIVQDWSISNQIVEPDMLELILKYIKEASTHIHYEVVKKFVHKIGTVPDYVDWNQIERAQHFFLKYAMANEITLFYQSLIGGYSIPRINKVLTCTGYLSGNPKNVLKRLRETQKMIVDAMKYNALLPGNVGWKSITRVRFLHAKIRQRILKLPIEKYSEKEDGIPINQEDLNFTLTGFSHIPLDGLENIFNIHPSEQEKKDWIALWRLIGHYLGIDEDLNVCASVDIARIWNESMALHLIKNPDLNAMQLSRAGLMSLELQDKGMGYKSLDEGIANAIIVLGEDWEKQVLLMDGNEKFKLQGMKRVYLMAKCRYKILRMRAQLFVGGILHDTIGFFIGKTRLLRWKGRVMFVIIDRVFKKHTVGNKFYLKEGEVDGGVKREPCSFHEINEVLGKDLFLKEQVYTAKMSEFVLIPFLLTETYITLAKFVGICLFVGYVYSKYF